MLAGTAFSSATQTVVPQHGADASTPLLPNHSTSPPHTPSSSLLSGTFNLTNSLLGGGISYIALPLAFSQVTFFPFLVLLFLSAVANIFSCHLLVKSEVLTKGSTYFELADRSLGSFYKHLVTAFIFLNNAGVCVAFLSTFGDTFPSILAKVHIHVSKESCVALVTLIVLLPTVILKDVHSLRHLSFLSIVLCLYFALLVVCTFFTSAPSPLPSPAAPTFFGCLDALAAVTLSYTCQFNVLPIKEGLKDKKDIAMVVK